jgi:uncharacterized metal-binding protein
MPVKKKTTKKKTITRKPKASKNPPQLVPNCYIDVDYWSKVFRVEEITRTLKLLAFLGLVFGVSFAVTLGALLAMKLV